MTQTRTLEQLLDLAKDLSCLQSLLMGIDHSSPEKQTRMKVLALAMMEASKGASLSNETVLKYLEDKYLPR